MKKFIVTTIMVVLLGMTSYAYNSNINSSLMSVGFTSADVTFAWTITGGATFNNPGDSVSIFFELYDITLGLPIGSQYVNHTKTLGDSVNTGVVYTLVGLTPAHQYRIRPHLVLYQNGSFVDFANGADLFFSTNCNPPTVTVNNPTICAGATATLTATGATTYVWNTGATTNSINVNPASTTTYTVTGTSGACTGTAIATVTVNPNPIVTVNNPTICAGTTATLTANGATTYLWNTGSTLNSISINPAATTSYTVTGTTGSCSATAVATTTVNSSPVILITGGGSICIGNSATLTASGATGYAWSTGSFSNTIVINPISTVTYTVTGTTSGCTGTATVTVTVNPNPIIVVNSPTICAGVTATLTASGAQSYLWNDGEMTSSISPSPVSTTSYSVTGTSLGCTGTAVATVTVNPNPIVTVNSPTICLGNFTTLTANGAVSYSWSTGSHSNPIAVNPGSTTTYTVTGTTLGCIGTATSIVNVNPNPVISITGGGNICAGDVTQLTAVGAISYVWAPITGLSDPNIANPVASPTTTTNYVVTGNLIGCTGTANVIVNVSNPISLSVNNPTICAGATATLTATGATTYVWNTGATTNSINVNPASTTTYTVTGTSGACTGTAIATVTVNPNPIVTVNNPTICAGTTATLTANGATTYLWNTGSTLNPISINPAATTSYTVTGTTGGCTGTTISTVTVNPNPVVMVTPSSTSICLGGFTTLTASGADTYQWNNGATTGFIVDNPSTNTSYTVTGTTSGCTGTATANVTVNVIPTVVTVNSPTICAGTHVMLTAVGAVSYVWSNGSMFDTTTVNPSTTATYTVTGTTSGCTGTAVALVTVNPSPIVTVNSPTICSGTSITLKAIGATSYVWNTGATTDSIVVNPMINTSYTVTGTNAGCIGTAISTVTVNLNPVVTVNNPTICAGATATLTATGATTYVWNTGATTNSINVNPASTTTYTVTGTSGACTGTAIATVTVNPNPIVTVNNPTICAGTTATLTANGATTYLWNTGSTLNPIFVNPAATTSYTVTGTTLGCTGTTISTVTVNPNPVVMVTPSSTSICLGQTAILTANGATTYSWSTGGTNDTVMPSPITNTSYTVTGTTSGCTGTAVALVTVNPSPIVTVNSPTICSGQTATLTASGATTYLWNIGDTTNLINVSPITNTSYTVTGTTLGCTGTAVALVTVNLSPNVIVNSPTICVGTSAILNAAGATTYLWSTGSSLNPITVSPLTTTTYTVAGLSLNGCMSTALSTVTVNLNPIVTVNNSNICAGNYAILTANGATTYSWSTGGTNDTIIINPAITTTYTVIGTTLGCADTTTAVVTVSPPVNLILSLNDSICFGNSIQLTATGSVGTTYQWSPAGSLNNSNIANPMASPANTTTYVTTATNGACVEIGSVTISVFNNVNLVVSSNDIICLGTSTNLTASGATTYSWSPATSLSNPNIANPVASPTSTIIYTATGNNGVCSGTATVNIIVDSIPVVTSGILSGGTFVLSGSFPGNISSITSGGVVYTPMMGNSSQAVFTNVTLTDSAIVLVETISSSCFTTWQYICTGVKEEQLKNQISFYPNPFSDVLNVKIQNGEYKVSLVSTTGQIVREMLVNGDFSIQRDNLASGIYFMRIIFSDGNKFCCKKVEIK